MSASFLDRRAGVYGAVALGLTVMALAFLPEATPALAFSLVVIGGGIAFASGVYAWWRSRSPVEASPSPGTRIKATGASINIGRVDSFSMTDTTLVGRDQIMTPRVEPDPPKQKLPLPGFQARSDMLRLKARKFRVDNRDDRVMWLHDLLPPEEWADYADVLAGWERDYAVKIIRRDNATGQPDIKFKVPRQF